MNKTNIEAKAKRNGNCKAVRCLTNGKFYHSVKEAAIDNGVHFSAISYAIRKGGKCNGKEFGFESNMEKNIMKMASNLSASEINSSEMAEFRAWKAEKELIRKAKEEREQKMAKLEAKLVRYESLIDKTEQRKTYLLSEMASVAFELKALRETEV